MTSFCDDTLLACISIYNSIYFLIAKLPIPFKVGLDSIAPVIKWYCYFWVSKRGNNARLVRHQPHWCINLREIHSFVPLNHLFFPPLRPSLHHSLPPSIHPSTHPSIPPWIHQPIHPSYAWAGLQTSHTEIRDSIHLKITLTHIFTHTHTHTHRRLHWKCN